MQTNIPVEPEKKRDSHPVRLPPRRNYPPLLLPLALIGAILLLDAVLPLAGFWFHTASLPTIGTWSLLPTHLLFPGWAVSTSITSANPTSPPDLLGWQQMPFLIGAFLLFFSGYLLALRLLPRSVTSFRYIFYTTLLLGAVAILIPVVTSPDIFSYIAYARMGVIYHLNPLTTLPTAIRNDPIYPQLYWNTQPSAYGPTWTAITSVLQWLTLVFGTQSLLPMVLALRLLGLATHLCSTLLIWFIVGRVQLRQGQVSAPKRWLATLAFAWNPLLLFEACVNAHNDAQLLLLVLLAIWFLLPSQSVANGVEKMNEVRDIRQLDGPINRRLAAINRPLPRIGTSGLDNTLPVLAIVMLALAACLKLNIVVLLPFVLIFLWKQARRPLATVTLATLLFGGLILLLYAPFWQHGAILNLLHTNPTTSRDINTLPEFLSHLYNSITINLGFPHPPLIGSTAETISHTLSIGLFVLCYLGLCWQAIRSVPALQTIASLIRWLALAWLLYCAVGTPWFWPWYLVTFFGLYALVFATCTVGESFVGLRNIPVAIAILTFSMLSLYCFYAWSPNATYIPGLPDFQWAYLRGLWAWLLPLLALRVSRNHPIAQRYHRDLENAAE